MNSWPDGMNVPPTLLTIAAADGRTLLEINRDGTVSGSLGDAGEAAERFVEFVRRSLGGGVGFVTGERGSDVSITDLVARLRYRSTSANPLALHDVAAVMAVAADALEEDERYINRLEAKVATLESVTVPTENEREALDAADRLELALDPHKREGWTRLQDVGEPSEIDDLRTVIRAVRTTVPVDRSSGVSS